MAVLPFANEGGDPDYDKRERLLPNHVRLHMVQNAMHFFAPLPIHLDLEQRVSRMIREGYRMCNTMSHGYWHATNDKLKFFEQLASSSEIRCNECAHAAPWFHRHRLPRRR